MALNNCKLIGSGGIQNLVNHEHGAGQSGIPNQVLYIIPNEGYAVSAVDFSVSDVSYASNNNSLTWTHDGTSITIADGNINSITLSNTSTAGEPDNKVKVEVDVKDDYQMPSANTTLIIDIDGNAIDLSLIRVIPHLEVTANASLVNLMLNTLSVTPVASDTINYPPEITMHQHTDYNATNPAGDKHIDYFECTIQPDVMTKIATIVIEAGAHNININPLFLAGIEGGYGYLKYDLVETAAIVDPGTATGVSSGAIYKREYDLYFQDSVATELGWPSNYGSLGLFNTNYGARLVVERGVMLAPIVSEVTIDTFDFHNDLTDTVSDEGIPDKIDVVGLTAYDISVGGVNNTLPNASNPFMPGAVGTIVKADDDEPNLISIVGTPGATFTLGMQENNTDKTSQVGLPTVDNGSGTQVPAVSTIPASGVFTTKLKGIPENTGSTKNWDLTITAGSETLISPNSLKPQMTNSTITNAKANNTVMRFVQPKASVNLSVQGTSTSGDITITSYACQISGFGTSNVSTQEYKNDVYTYKPFTITGTAAGGTCTVTGVASFEKFGDDDLTLSLDLDNIFTLKEGGGFDSVTQPTEYVSAGMSTNNTKSLGSFTESSASTGAELSVSSLFASFTNTGN